LATRDKTRIQILALIEQHGPLGIDAMREHMNYSISRAALYKACIATAGVGYLSMATVQDKYGSGRPHAVFSRTDKPYPVERAPTERALMRREQKREAERRRRERQELRLAEEERKARLKAFTPFRHPLDEAFFGPYPHPVQVSTVERRLIENGWRA